MQDKTAGKSNCFKKMTASRASKNFEICHFNIKKWCILSESIVLFCCFAATATQPELVAGQQVHIGTNFNQI